MTTADLLHASFPHGSHWNEYLDHVPRSRAMQEDRYEAVTDRTLADFRQLDLRGVRALLLSAAGCGDSAWALPRLVRLLDEVPGLETRIFLREDHPELQERLLTNGKRAVPKLALIDSSGQVLGTWGPRPHTIQTYVEQSIARGLERREWYGNVLRYYREQGSADLDSELYRLLRSVEDSHAAH